jgi:hypothetical protein
MAKPRFKKGDRVAWDYRALTYPRKRFRGSGQVTAVFKELGNMPTNYAVEGHERRVLFEDELRRA